MMTKRQLAALETKEKILGAGRLIICEKGLDSTTVEEITEAAGVSKGTFYTYFKRKEDIVFALSYGMFGEILENAKNFEGSFLQKLEHYMVCFSEYIEQGSVKLAQEWARNVVNPALTDDSYDKGKLQFDLVSVENLLTHGIQQGLLKDEIPVKGLSQALVDILYGQMFCWAMSDGRYSLKGRTEEFCRGSLEDLIGKYMK
ncbi:MAG: TetR/AcrR family transcriptional regulator [Firmicutes bacterium]|jgi:TetR/AcrR family fatty acid metabolism transcriptional regulator|nr:TetR/AcrR family transcriptional regulator [Bacillota bacterium]